MILEGLICMTTIPWDTEIVVSSTKAMLKKLKTKSKSRGNAGRKPRQSFKVLSKNITVKKDPLTYSQLFRRRLSLKSNKGVSPLNWLRDIQALDTVSPATA